MLNALAEDDRLQGDPCQYWLNVVNTGLTFTELREMRKTATPNQGLHRSF